MSEQYADKELRRIINEAERMQEINSQSIYEGVVIKNERYEFEEVKFFKDRLEIYLPKSFVDMPQQAVFVTYPSVGQPEIIKSNKPATVNITLSLIPNNITNEHIEKVIESLKNILDKKNPSTIFFEEGLEQVHGKTTGYFDCKIPVVDEILYHLMFVLEIEGNIVQGTFNCLYEEYEPWRPIAFQIMKSARTNFHR